MKQIIKSLQFTFLALVILSFTGCLKDDDLMTDGVRTGGLVVTTSSVPYKLGSTPTFDINVKVPQGAAVKSILVYKQFTHKADTTESNKVLYATIDVNSGNVAAPFVTKLTLTWANLINGLTLPKYTLPADEMLSDIGDYFTFSYIAVMASDNLEVINVKSTSVSIANFFAGNYKVTGYFDHPTASREINMDKTLVAMDPSTCQTLYADFGDATLLLDINIDPVTYAITLTGNAYAATPGSPKDPAVHSSYDPATGIIELWYYYMGGNGPRIIHEIYTPQ